jgi:hypothetical protein
VKRLKRLVKAALFLFCLAAGLLVISHLVLRPNPTLADAEQYAVLSAYIQPRLTGDSHDLGSQHVAVIIFRNPTYSSQLRDNTRLRQYALLVASTQLRKAAMPSLMPAILFEFYATNLRSTPFKRQFQLSAPYELASMEDLQLYPSNQFWTRFPSAYGYLTFSRIAFNRHLTEAFFYTEHICGMCGEGKFVLMRKVEGKWVVQDTASTWIS